VLTGKRVRLRSIRRDDLQRLWQFNNDLDVELAGGGDPPMPQALERLQADFDRQAAQGGRDGSMFAIAVDDLVIGQCALFDINTTSRTAQLGITIGDKSYWGRGLGREAVGLLLDYAFSYHNYRRVWLWVHGDNERAIRAYRACGFVEEGCLREHMFSKGRYVDAVYMGILRNEWETNGLE
jgi:RimJ/RimL family protein N-acetyltransferase